MNAENQRDNVTGEQVDRDAFGVFQMRKRRARSILPINFVRRAGWTTAGLLDVLPIAPSRVLCLAMPGREVADADPSRNSRPTLRRAASQKHRHVSAARGADEINALAVGFVTLLHKIDSIQHVGHR